MIEFEFDGVRYEVEPEAYEYEKVLLPDGRLIEVLGWYEGKPPKPIQLREITHDFKGSLVEIANHFEAVIAVVKK